MPLAVRWKPRPGFPSGIFLGEPLTHQGCELVLKASGSWEGADAGDLSAVSAGYRWSDKTSKRPQCGGDADRCTENGFLIAGHGTGLVVGSLPDTSTISIEFWSDWSGSGQSSQQFW